MQPTSAEAIQGSEATLATVLRTVERGAVHAVLLYGQAGGPKDAIADRLVRGWLGPDESRAVNSYGRGNNPDVLDIRPSDTNDEISVRNIRIAQRRPDDPLSVSEFLRTPPLMSEHKVVWIHDAHRMHPRAANALLKTLEEPPDFGRFVLTTPSIGSILPTILSRCLSLACPAPAHDQLGATLGGIDPQLHGLASIAPETRIAIQSNPAPFLELAQFAARLPEAGPRTALVLSEQFRGIIERVAKAMGLEKKGAALTLELLALLTARNANAPGEWAQHMTETHRRIRQSGNVDILTDALFVRIMGIRPRRRAEVGVQSEPGDSPHA
jgi:DNA polymerase-3 subunit delta'